MRQAILLSLIPTLVLAQEDFTRRDRTALLYQTKFVFTPDHCPVVNILVMEGVPSARFGTDGPIELLPEGEGGPSLRLGSGRVECSATLEGGRPGRIRWWVALARVTGADLDAVRQEQAALEARGFKVRLFERGSVFGFFGKVLDNRVWVLVEDLPHETLEKARARRDVVAPEVKAADVFEEMVERPFGIIRVACPGVNASFPGLVAIAPPPGKTIHVRDVEFGKGFAWHGHEDRSYRGQIYLTADRNGRLAIVNVVDAETLLKGLVPSEVWPDAPMEALKAQAVAARSELFAKLGQRHTADPYMVCGDVHCQVYRGTAREDERTSRAVDETRGEMLFAGDRLVDAVYCASCGGHTESAAAVWPGEARQPLSGVLDGPEGVLDPLAQGPSEDAVLTFLRSPPRGVYCGSSRFGRDSFRWQRFVSLTDIRRGVLEQTGRDVGSVKGLRTLERGVSGRVMRLEVQGTDGNVELTSELSIRKALGGLKSSLFAIVGRTSEGGVDGIQLLGGGFGHGAGMCQTGAVGMAEHGRRYREILGHYYVGAAVVRIY